MNKRFVSTCPACSSRLAITRLTCDACHTQIDTTLEIPTFLRLPADLQQFVMTFLACRGNIREVEKALGISYPTVCKRLDLVNQLLGNPRTGDASRNDGNDPIAPGGATNRSQILEQLERGEITARQAAQLLKGDVS